MENQKNYTLLPHCGKEAENLDIVLACDGAASVGQVGHAVAVKLTNKVENTRMCCLSAVAARSPTHVGIAEKAKKLIVINGCPNECASKILRQLNIKPTYEIIISKENVEKIPTLDFNDDDVNRITEKIVSEVSKLPDKGKD